MKVMVSNTSLNELNRLFLLAAFIILSSVIAACIVELYSQPLNKFIRNVLLNKTEVLTVVVS